MIRLTSLVLVLAAMWFALSGETSPLFLALAAISILFVLALAWRLRTIDAEGAPYPKALSLIPYFAWLGVEIVKANIVVIRAVLAPGYRISPALVRVPMSERSGLARALYANSITLTPGTVTLVVGDDSLLVHALQEETARPEDFVQMDARSLRAADGRG